MGKGHSKPKPDVGLPELPGTNEPSLPFPLGEPILDIVEHLSNNYAELEFQRIEKNSAINPPACDEAFKDHNKPKNRYTYVVPYDVTRVKLTPVENQDGSDYINASWVHGKTYIATQGPLPQTFADFWRMIWEYDVKVILMLTKTFENGRMKCHRYWPEDKEPEIHNELYKVQLVQEDEIEQFATTVRKFTLTNIKKGEDREIVQYQYHGWPDHGTPDDTKAIRELVRKVEEINKEKNAPVVVHCSAGIGRTGTFCAVHITLSKIREHIKQNSGKPYPFDLYKTVMDLRSQRSGMVQQPEQFRFCYESIIDGALELGLSINNVDVLIKAREALKKQPSETSPDSESSYELKKLQASQSTDAYYSKTGSGYQEGSQEAKQPTTDPEQPQTEHKKKKKKKKHTTEQGSEEAVNGTTESDKTTENGTEEPKKKKKKKKKKHTEDGATTSSDPEKKHKKKHKKRSSQPEEAKPQESEEKQATEAKQTTE